MLSAMMRRIDALKSAASETRSGVRRSVRRHRCFRSPLGHRTLRSSTSARGDEDCGAARQAIFWTAGHLRARGFWTRRQTFEFAARVSSTVHVIDLVGEQEAEWRRLVFRGERAFSRRDEREFLAAYRSWIRLANRLIREFGETPRSGSLAIGMGVLEAKLCKVSESLNNWSPPSLSMAIGLRDDYLTESEAADLDRIISGKGELPYEPKSQPQKALPPSEFFRRFKG